MPIDDDQRRAFGARLKAARERKTMTQADVADLFGINKATVSAWETGAGVPDALRLRALAKMYSTSADALLWDDAPSQEALQFAARFDRLTQDQRRTVMAVWSALTGVDVAA